MSLQVQDGARKCSAAFRWTVGVGVGAVLALSLVLLFLLTQATGNRELYERNYARLLVLNIGVAILLLLVRDCALALFFVFDAKNRRAMAAFLLLMAVLYGLLPMLLGATGSNFLPSLVNPMQGQGSMTILIAVIHAAIALALLRWRWLTTEN